MLLGLDLGTTNIKALVVAKDGTIIAEGSAPVSLHHVADGGVVLSPALSIAALYFSSAASRSPSAR